MGICTSAGFCFSHSVNQDDNFTRNNKSSQSPTDGSVNPVDQSAAEALKIAGRTQTLNDVFNLAVDATANKPRRDILLAEHKFRF